MIYPQYVLAQRGTLHIHMILTLIILMIGRLLNTVNQKMMLWKMGHLMGLWRNSVKGTSVHPVCHVRPPPNVAVVINDLEICEMLFAVKNNNTEEK